ncbi:MAG TPA: hypothetical protein VGB11_02260 [Candidatus Bathyarchaeia archaeon]|jgi:hypothetical protein
MLITPPPQNGTIFNPQTKAQSCDSMNNQKVKEKLRAKLPSREELILMEQETIRELQRMLNDPDLTFTERLRAANVLAFHMNTLNRMLTQNGAKEQFEEQNLGDYVRGLEPRIYSRFRRDFKVWKRRLSYKRY